MTIEETKEEYGYDAEQLCKNLCYDCTANDWFCPSDCEVIAWVRKHYDKAIDRLAKLDGDSAEFFRRYKKYKWK